MWHISSSAPNITVALLKGAVNIIFVNLWKA
jgi:hypothetical protein